MVFRDGVVLVQTFQTLFYGCGAYPFFAND